jgi:hypothetical protein
MIMDALSCCEVGVGIWERPIVSFGVRESKSAAALIAEGLLTLDS